VTGGPCFKKGEKLFEAVPKGGKGGEVWNHKWEGTSRWGEDYILYADGRGEEEIVSIKNARIARGGGGGNSIGVEARSSTEEEEV